MVSRYMIFLAILVVPGSVLYGQSDSTLIVWKADFRPDLVMQVGAFRLEQNALALKDRLSASLEKTVLIVTENGYFKVRVTGFKSLDEMEKIYPALRLLGMMDIWVVPLKKPEVNESQIDVKPDTTTKAIEEKFLIAEPGFFLQAGVFHRKSKALRARRRITTKLDLPVDIVQEWEYYKVIISGFRSPEETYKYYPQLAHMGYPDIILIENYRKNR